METLCYSRYYRKRLNGHTNEAKIENSKEGGKEKKHDSRDRCRE